MTMKIEWRDIPGYEGEYQASNTGEVRSLDRYQTVTNRWGSTTTRFLRGRTLYVHTLRNGYLKVFLGYKNGHLVHRLVAMAFLRGDYSLQVNHKNGNRGDNRATNLEWVSASDNQLHAHRLSHRKPHSLTKKVVIEGTVYESQLQAAMALNVSVGSICSAVRRGHKCKGKIVSYV